MKFFANDEGFTLIELMIVIAIIGIFTSLALPRVAGVKGQAEKQVALSQITNIAEAIEMHYLVEGDYPDSEGDYGDLHNDIEDYINLSTLDNLNVEGFTYSLLEDAEDTEDNIDGFKIEFEIDDLDYRYRTDKGLQIDEDGNGSWEQL
ncbi:prepilin-type N-terminal cleavage/methylation domain-containing protein [Natroniella acetigena]|uniref:type II secretion system protein n=1 Tax=Natroniella acetigena TaxID=52004 RepID=UPI00200A619F|nr:prepilin-type N-terminal cleavage/methylation domain-containing protein [Natroniella acetigena]MCK8826655.1 prepilin-type N-terminal cleavage/methylation domain-containing protein [Natroniella acetigena]